MDMIKQFQKEIRSMILGTPDKYSEYIQRLVDSLCSLYEKFRSSYNTCLKSKYYLKLSMIQNNNLKNTIKKYEEDLSEKRKEEMQVLERIIANSSKKGGDSNKGESQKTERSRFVSCLKTL